MASRKVNTRGSDEKRTLKRYEKEYCQSPPKYAVMGFDIVYDLISRFDNEKKLMTNLDAGSTQLETKYEFQRLP